MLSSRNSANDRYGAQMPFNTPDGLPLNLTVDYILGGQEVLQNHWYGDDTRARPRRTIGQMFFQPYESEQEFVFCARHTITPALLLGIILLKPLTIMPLLLITGICAGLLVLSGASSGLGFKVAASFAFEIVESITKDLCQALIDLVLLPLSSLIMLTRGVSTGLKATGVYNFDAEEVSEAPTLSMT